MANTQTLWHEIEDISLGSTRHASLQSLPAASTLSALGREMLEGTANGWAGTTEQRSLDTDTDQPCGGAIKRVADITIALVALILLLPAMLVIAAVIKLTMGGDIFYAHSRVGFGGRSFPCIKFRSMVSNGDAILKRHLVVNPSAQQEWTVTQKLRNDPRIPPVGGFLRRTSLDELPQLINVLRGDMSCVGPRPITSAELSRYGARAKDYLQARPGMTGFWQVSGRSRLSYRRRVALDSVYVRRWSLKLDAAILLRTIPAVVFSNGAR